MIKKKDCKFPLTPTGTKKNKYQQLTLQNNELAGMHTSYQALYHAQFYCWLMTL